VALTAVDRALLQKCLKHEPGAWQQFVDRYIGLIYHIIQHTAHHWAVPLRPEDTEDLAADILLQILNNDYAALRQFRGQSSLATYLTVIARRFCIQEMGKRSARPAVQTASDGERLAEAHAADGNAAQAGLESLEEVQKLLGKLPAREREVVRLYYLEGRTYEEISTEMHVPVNSIGPILTRARKKLRKDVKSPPRVVRDARTKAQEEK
jgi:RNA polymerase sigma-70 factor (ECF subfamily)